MSKVLYLALILQLCGALSFAQVPILPEKDFREETKDLIDLSTVPNEYVPLAIAAKEYFIAVALFMATEDPQYLSEQNFKSLGFDIDHALVPVFERSTLKAINPQATGGWPFADLDRSSITLMPNNSPLLRQGFPRIDEKLDGLSIEQAGVIKLVLVENGLHEHHLEFPVFLSTDGQLKLILLINRLHQTGTVGVTDENRALAEQMGISNQPVEARREEIIRQARGHQLVGYWPGLVGLGVTLAGIGLFLAVRRLTTH